MCAGNVKVGVVFALVLLTASMAAAQPREGLWGGLGSGFGTAAISCTDCDSGREGSGVGDTTTAAKAVNMYRTTPPSGTKGLTAVTTSGGK